MKKLLFILTISILSVNCSNGDEFSTHNEQPSVQTQYFHPPTWIQGSWTNIPGIVLFKFTHNDVFLLPSSTSIGLATTIIQNPYGGYVNETITSTEYTFEVVYNNLTTVRRYEFRKVSGQVQLKDSGVWVNLTKL